MLRNIIFIILFPVILTTAGCGIFAGAMTGAGVFSYMNGELTRSYQSDFNTTVKACTDALQASNLTIKETILEGLSAKITSEYYNGKPVSIKIMRYETNISKVSIRSGIMGVWDKDLSEQIHVSIAGYLQQ
ncbi:DUF3568 [Desulfonema limicola]|uniref:DUF3568 n=1 Tax=Desulfonema limicola TaxID=45656 RepID=A0A975BEP5_9BACT|nr:DUF3568 family protein [Desulfonema limicola]QTA83769.1 DUF3568 [Desulfonema limicola]